jgi:dCMP deaminase
MRTLVAYVPVLHEGYRRFFEKNAEAKELYIFGPEILAEFSWLAKEIRQLDPELMRTAIESLGIFEKVTVLTIAGAESLNKAGLEIILPDEDVSRTLATNYLSNASVTFDTIFLRWDKRRTVMKDLAVEAERSSDFWRHVGAAIVKDEEVLFVAHNQHLPSEHSPYVHGDPRNNFHKGGHIEISTAFHAEVSLIAEAARKGIALEGADMYVTVFPCPPCAKAIAFSGIKNLYYENGYSVLDGEDVLKGRGIKIWRVE